MKMEDRNRHSAAIFGFAIALVIATTASLTTAATLEPFPVDWHGSLFAEPVGNVLDALEEGVSESADAEADYMDELVDPLLEDASVPCEPGTIHAKSRAALGELR